MRISALVPPELTPEIVYLKGEFSLWKYKIPYYCAVVPAKFAADKFSLIDDIPDAERIEWSLEELFQRDIAWERIETDLLAYLKNENRPQFFNALTIALLPKRGHGFGGEYTTPHTYAAIPDAQLDAPIQIGGIQIQPFKDSSESAGKLRWDVAEIMAVAVDGQHRLAAIKRFASFVKPDTLQHAQIPVIFIVPHPLTGFVEPPQPEGKTAVVSTLRRIFIDLNKNARSVTATRRILLDDNDIVSICTRDLIGQRLGHQQGDDRIPLVMVDWISEKNKIESGPFVTTVLILHDIVNRVIQMPSVVEWDEDDENRIENKVKRWLVEVFSPGAMELEDLMSRVRRCINQQIPLTFMPDELRILRERFGVWWRPLIFRLFSELKPYRVLSEFGKKEGLHKPAFVNLYAAETAAEGGQRAKDRFDNIKAKVGEDDPDWNENKNYRQPLKRIDDEIKGKSWAFKVVFQKALFWSFLDLLNQASIFAGDNLSSEEQRSKFTTQWIEAINRLLESDLGGEEATFSRPKEKFWTGIGLHSDETIEYTTAGSKRIAKWLSLWVCMYWLKTEIPSAERLESDERILATIMWNILDSQPVMKGMIKLANTKLPADADEELINKEAKALIYKRYEHLRKLAAAIPAS